MTKMRKIEAKNIRRQNREFTRQLSVTDLTDFSHGEERSSPMRDGFYTRRHHSLI